jgi:hypothetical protein
MHNAAARPRFRFSAGLLALTAVNRGGQEARWMCGGNDTLHGSGGALEADRLTGGPGADTFVLMNGRERSYAAPVLPRETDGSMMLENRERAKASRG